ncbi:hypothetical protein AB7Y52_17970, partial [Escherichia coli]
SLKTSIKTITYLSDIGCLEIQGASLWPLLITVDSSTHHSGYPTVYSGFSPLYSGCFAPYSGLFALYSGYRSCLKADGTTV